MSQKVHHALSDPVELLLTLSRMRSNLPEEDLHNHQTVITVSESFITWTNRLHYCLALSIKFPDLKKAQDIFVQSRESVSKENLQISILLLTVQKSLLRSLQIVLHKRQLGRIKGAQ